jgi:hypothetical protein
MTTARHLTDLPRAHGERIALAVQDLLLTDELLTTWTGGRIYRVADARLWPDKPRPMITIGPELASLPVRLQGQTEVSLGLLVTLFYDEPRVTMAPEEKGVESLLHHVWRALVGTREARFLAVERYDGKSLVMEPPRSSDFQQAMAYTGAVHADGSPVVERYPQLQLTYRYALERDTGQPQGFSADD